MASIEAINGSARREVAAARRKASPAPLGAHRLAVVFFPRPRGKTKKERSFIKYFMVECF